jgi:organic radical activating enzyme
MNICINNYCNQKCPYCFASDYIKKEGKNMTFSNFKKVVDFLKKSNHKYLRIAGGEPTLHPEFKEFIDWGINEGFGIVLMTNGLFDKDVQSFLYEKRDYLSYLWNINNPGFYKKKQWELLESNLHKLVDSEGSTFGVNIYSINQDLNYIFSLAKKFKPSSIRYVLVHKINGKNKNNVIKLQDISSTTKKIVNLTKKLGDQLGIGCTFDCGFIPCLWDDKDLGILLKYNVSLGKCKICPTVDFDLKISHCFHKYDEKDCSELDKFKNYKEIKEYLSNIKKKYSNTSLFNKCKGCVHKKLLACDGGCMEDRIYYDKNSRI